MLNFVYFSYMDIFLISSSNISYKTAESKRRSFLVYRWFRVAISVGMWYTLIEMNAKKRGCYSPLLAATARKAYTNRRDANIYAER